MSKFPRSHSSGFVWMNDPPASRFGFSYRRKKVEIVVWDLSSDCFRQRTPSVRINLGEDAVDEWVEGKEQQQLETKRTCPKLGAQHDKTKRNRCVSYVLQTSSVFWEDDDDVVVARLALSALRKENSRHTGRTARRRATRVPFGLWCDPEFFHSYVIPGRKNSNPIGLSVFSELAESGCLYSSKNILIHVVEPSTGIHRICFLVGVVNKRSTICDDGDHHLNLILITTGNWKINHHVEQLHAQHAVPPGTLPLKRLSFRIHF